MSQWLPEFSGEAERDLAHLDRRIQERVLEKIDWFLKNFDSIVHIPLAGEYRDFFKLRIGDWRIFYSIRWKEGIIRIENIENRNQAYRKKK